MLGERVAQQVRDRGLMLARLALPCRIVAIEHAVQYRSRPLSGFVWGQRAMFAKRHAPLGRAVPGRPILAKIGDRTIAVATNSEALRFIVPDNPAGSSSPSASTNRFVIFATGSPTIAKFAFRVGTMSAPE